MNESLIVKTSFTLLLISLTMCFVPIVYASFPKPFTFARVPLGNEYLETVETKGYSMLHKISEVDYQIGLKELRAAYAAGESLEYALGYTFIWGSKST